MRNKSRKVAEIKVLIEQVTGRWSDNKTACCILCLYNMIILILSKRYFGKH